MEKRRVAAVLIFFLVISLFFAFLLAKPSKNTSEIEKISFEKSSSVKIRIPAIDINGRGVSAMLVVDAVNGTGKTLVDINSLLFWTDTQQSIRVAKSVAENFSDSNPKTYDVIYSIEADTPVIGGPSAGAALALATIFALTGRQPRQDVIITGAINHDGTIGPVSGILEKAKVSKVTGASIFLVPLLHAREIIYETKEHCEKIGSREICSDESIPKKINISEETGIDVVEIANITDAIKYFEKR